MTPAARLHFVSPGPLDQPTGGYRYDGRILDALKKKGVPLACHALPGRFPDVDPAARAAAARLWRDLDRRDRIVVDGLALPAFRGLASDERHGPRLFVLVHHPLYLETGLPSATAARMRRQEAAQLRAAAGVIVTSEATRDAVAAMGVTNVPIRIVVPGTEKALPAKGAGDGTPALLCVGSLIPRKGHTLLLSALSGLGHLGWRLRCVGPTDRHDETARAVQAMLEHPALADRVILTGAVSDAELAAHYDTSDLFVLASRYEGYGMAFAEALAHGLPIVASGDGAVRDTVPVGSGLVVPVGDRAAMTAALAMVIGDPQLRRRLRTGAVAAGAALPDWADQADRFLRAVSA